MVRLNTPSNIELSQNKQAKEINKTWEAASCVQQKRRSWKARQVCDDNNAAIFTSSSRLVTKSEREKRRSRRKSVRRSKQRMQCELYPKQICYFCHFERTRTERQTDGGEQSVWIGDRERHACRRPTAVTTTRLNCDQKLHCCSDEKYALKMSTSCLAVKLSDSVT